jgi:SAM-dependent methyltransferase
METRHNPVCQDKASRACPLCSSAGFRHLPQYSEGAWNIVQCGQCDFVFLQNPPGYDALVEDYAWEKTRLKETERRLVVRSVSARLSRHSRWRLGFFGRSRKNLLKYFAIGNILDIGCGGGGILINAGGIPHGIEISKELCRSAEGKMRQRGGYCVHAPAIEGVSHFPEAFFDGILMRSFLEHEENPAILINQLARILKPGGLIYIRVPNYGSLNRKVTGKKWCGFRYPDHVNYFTVTSLKQMSALYDFEFQLLNPLNIFLDDNIKALLIRRDT